MPRTPKEQLGQLPGTFQDQQPDHGQLCFRALGMAGPLPQYLNPEMQLTVQIEDLTAPEYQWLRRTRRVTAGFSVPAVAGQRGYVQVDASVTSPTGLVVLERVQLLQTTGATLNFQVGLGSTPGPLTQQTVSGMDDRAPLGTAIGRALLGQNAAPVVPPQAQTLFAVSGVALDLPVPWIIAGSSVWSLICVTVNQTFTVVLQWRERLRLLTEH